MWNYLPQATRLAAEIQSQFQINPELIKSSGGKFEVVADGQLIFSKKQQGRFPEHAEVLQKIADQL